MKIFNFVLLIFVCLCAKAQADTCDVGVDGCTWTCIPPPPGTVHCMIATPVPTTCEIGSSETTCGTTCTCSKAEKCTVGVNGCQWSCVNIPPTSGPHCLAIVKPPSECTPGQKITDCVKTCTCIIRSRCNNMTR